MKKFYISFGQSHTHNISGKTFDCNCLGVIKAKNYLGARRIAFELTKGVFCFIYDDLEKAGLEYYPRGLIPMN